MEFANVVSSLFNPVVLFFFLGVAAVVIKSDLEVPQEISKFLSQYLLFCIGLKGGEELAHSGLNATVFTSLGIAMLFATAVPIYAYYILRRTFNVYNAGAIAATYGSISAVTFITASAFLDDAGISHGGYMVAAMALMESPAIIVGVLLVRKYQNQNSGKKGEKLSELVKEALTNGSVVLIIGSLLIGLLAKEKTLEPIKPFTEDIFKGMLAFFLLDMGVIAGKRLRVLRIAGWRAVAYALIIPLINATLLLGLLSFISIPKGDALLLMVLVASASYIAVPAAMRLAVPKSNPGLYVPMSLAITFPFNIVIGIPLYYYLITLVS